MEKKVENKVENIKEMSLLEKLSNIQNELKAPKGQFNSFGKYKYRSCEDILEAVKPLCKKYKVVLLLGDDLVHKGDRYYIRATAKISDIESFNIISNTAYAREEEEKKGMDASQITGTSSSYARKYALNGLFNIDDTKDADTDEFKKQVDNGKEKVPKKVDGINYRDKLVEYIKDNELDFNEIAKEYKINTKTTNDRFKQVIDDLERIRTAPIEERLGQDE